MSPPMQEVIDRYVSEYTAKDPKTLMVLVAAQQSAYQDATDEKFKQLQTDINEIKKCGTETKESVWKHQVILDGHEGRLKEHDTEFAVLKASPPNAPMRTSLWAKMPLMNKILIVSIIGLVATAVGVELNPSFIGNVLALFGL